MRRLFVAYLTILLITACGDSVTSEGLEPTDIPHVSWPELESLILSGKAVMVAETHSNWAIVTLRTGQSVTSREPERGAVFRVVARCGTPCARIGIAIE